MANRGSNISFGLSARFLFIVAGVAILSNIVLMAAFLNLFPLHNIQRFFIQTENIADKSVYIQPFNMTADNKNLELKIIRSLVRQYVLEREKFSTDYRFVVNMWGGESTLRHMSSRKVYQNFMLSSTYKKVFVLGNGKRKSRFVKLKMGNLGINYHPIRKEWEVNGTVIDYQDGEMTKQSQDLSIILKIALSKRIKKTSYKNRFKNPFGFIVTDYKYLRKPSY